MSDSLEVQRLKHKLRFLGGEIKFWQKQAKLSEKQLKQCKAEIDQLKHQRAKNNVES